MQLEKENLIKCYHDAMILQYQNMLLANGFGVERGKVLKVDFLSHVVDLYASKDNEIRLYDFKIIGDNGYRKDQIFILKKIAASIGAKPFIIYVNPPTEKSIEIEGLGIALCTYIETEGVPSNISRLSAHTIIEDIEIDDLTYMYVSSDSIEVEGEALIFAHLQYSSDLYEKTEADASFPMSFKAKLDFDLSIKDLEYSIDTSSWDEFS